MVIDILLGAIISICTSIIKKISKKLGKEMSKNVVIIIVFVLSFIVAFLLKERILTEDMVVKFIGIGSYAIAIYEVIWKRIFASIFNKLKIRL